MKKKENITDIFMVYFLGKLYSGTYRKLYNSLRDIESIENLTGGNYKFDSNDREIKDFVEKFYDLSVALKKDIEIVWIMLILLKNKLDRYELK